MSIHLTQALVYLLTPGEAEKLRATMVVYKDREWKCITEYMQSYKNAFYVGLAFTIIGLVGFLISDCSATSSFIALTGVGIVTYASSELYELAQFLVKCESHCP